MGLITFLSSQPGRSGPPSALWAYLMNFAHAPLYGLLALWMALLLPRENGWPRIDRSFVDAERMVHGGFSAKFFSRLGLSDGGPIPRPTG